MTHANIMIVGGGATELSELTDSMGDLFVAPPVRAADAGDPVSPRPIQFARIAVDSELGLHLYLIAGDRKFSFIWGVLGRDMDGYVLLVNGKSPETIAAAQQAYLIVSRACAAPCVVAVTDEQHEDLRHQKAIAQALSLPSQCPMLACNCADRESVKRVLNALLQEIMQAMQAAPEAQTRDPVESPAAV